MTSMKTFSVAATSAPNGVRAWRRLVTDNNLDLSYGVRSAVGALNTDVSAKLPDSVGLSMKWPIPFLTMNSGLSTNQMPVFLGIENSGALGLISRAANNRAQGIRK